MVFVVLYVGVCKCAGKVTERQESILAWVVGMTTAPIYEKSSAANSYGSITGPKWTRNVPLETALRNRNSSKRRVVDVIYLKTTLSDLKGETSDGPGTPCNTPLNSVLSSSLSGQCSPVTFKRRFSDSGYLTSVSVPRNGLLSELDICKEESELISSEIEPAHSDFFSAIHCEVDLLLDYINTHRLSILHKVDNSSPDPAGEELDITEEVDMLQTPSGNPFVRHMYNLRRALHCLSETLSINMSDIYSLCKDYDRSFGSKSGVEHFQSHQPRVVECMSRISEAVFYLDEKMKVAEDQNDEKVEELRKSEIEKRRLSNCCQFIPILLHLLLFLTTWVVLTALIDRHSSTVAYYRLFRGPAIIVLFIYMLSLNMTIWSSNGIDYRHLFQFRPGVMPTAYEMVSIAGGFAIVFAAFSAVGLITLEWTSVILADKVLPCVLWSALILFLVQPYRCWYRKGRWGLVKALFRVVTAPFHKVHFCDFWLADQLNSLTVVLLDLEYLVCYCSRDWSQPPDAQMCANQTFYYIRPLISALPAWTRFWQCLRCAYDYGEVKHYINAMKYSCTIIVVATATLYTAHYPLGWPADGEWDTTGMVYISLWSVATVVRALYTFCWDVRMDWGLWTSCQKDRLLLRKDVRYHPTLVYYVVIVVDVILRFSQTLKISMGVFLHVKSDILFTLLAAGEVFRRFLWNFFRVEYEQTLQEEKPQMLIDSLSQEGTIQDH